MNLRKYVPIVFAVAFFMPTFAHAACLNLTADLSQGITDATAGGQVIALQNYLVAAGYLNAAPNGVFGPATLAAVKSFQTANNISATGTVGPLTRAALELKSCGVAPTPTPVATPTPTLTPTPVATPQSAPTATSIITTAPATGATLALGSNYTVKWSSPLNAATYNVVLEDQNGVAEGLITSSSYANQFAWHVGDVYNSNVGQDVTVPPGTYRVHVEDAAMGPQSSDRVGGYFTISTSVHISQEIPQAAPADGNTAIVLYGSNFSQNSQVEIYGYGNISPLFVSPDGRVLVFVVPVGTAAGSHPISVDNVYGVGNVIVSSNQTTLTVTSP